MKNDKMSEWIAACEEYNKIFEEALLCVETYDEGMSFWNWFQTDQGIEYKGNYFTSSLRSLAGHLVESVVKNGGKNTLRIDHNDYMSHMNFYCSDIPEDYEKHIEKFKTYGVNVVDFDLAYSKSLKYEEFFGEGVED